MIINYEYYQIFYYVASTKNITEAANHLFLSQSTVSRTLQNLERDLGCTLLIRSKHGLALTKEGEFLYEYVRKAFLQISMAEKHLHNVKSLTQGLLQIGATELTLQHFLLPYIKDFERLYPKIHINYDFEYPTTAIEKLNNGLLDIAVLTSPLEPQDSINYYPLAQTEQVIIAGRRYWKYCQAPIDLKSLEKEAFVLMRTGTSARTYAEELFATYEMPCFPKHESGSTPLIISMVAENLGIGIVPRPFAEEKLALGKILEIKPIQKLKPLQIYALTSKLFPVNAVRDKFFSQLKTDITNDLSLL